MCVKKDSLHVYTMMWEVPIPEKSWVNNHIDNGIYPNNINQEGLIKGKLIKERNNNRLRLHWAGFGNLVLAQNEIWFWSDAEWFEDNNLALARSNLGLFSCAFKPYEDVDSEATLGRRSGEDRSLF